jgi:NAD(P)-dependent dehydrogenase (short-subunit alcohol dehydrogenase family)
MKNPCVVLITGASSGIGLAAGSYLQSRGFEVVGTSRNPKNYPNHPFPLVPMDVQDNTSIQKAIERVFTQHGRLDVLVNNAGMGMAAPLEELEMEPIDRIMDTNLKGPIRVIQQVLKIMHKQQSGRIINVASLAGDNGLPFRSVYSASKAALMRITESLRLELRHTPIQCTTLSPGSIQTPIAANRFYAPLKGDSPYYTQYKNALSDMDAHVNKGLKPIEVAKKIAQLIQTKRLKPHYSVGPFLEVFSPVIKFFLPQRTYENVLASFYNLK